MSNRDPFEIVAGANPVPGLTERLPGDDEMLARILAMPVAPAAATKRRPRRRMIWFGAGVAVASVGLAAYAFIREDSPTDPLSIVCYSTPQTNPAVRVGLRMSEDPVGMCGQQWTNGVIASFRSPPVLTACISDGGLVAVIPGNQQVCENLGYANWVGELTDEERNLIAFQDALTSNFGDRCVTENNAQPRVRSIMVQFGYSEWTLVQRGGYTPARQCTGAVAFVEDQMVVLVSRRGTADT